MNISRKLMIIVVLTIFEISLTLFSMFEILQGAKFHQLNMLHLKYISEFSEQVMLTDDVDDLDTEKLRKVIYDIRQQPIDCLAQINGIEKFIMRRIGTYEAIELCEKDIVDANEGLKLIDSFVRNEISWQEFFVKLGSVSNILNQNSIDFEEPIVKTVEFIFNAMVPLVVIISIINIIFITYLSKNITGSINKVIALLSRENTNEAIDETISRNVSGEIKELLVVAGARLKEELVKTEINQKLELLVEQRTESLTKANDELAQFAYRMSHDLKAPLTSAKGLAQFVVQDIGEENFGEASENSVKIVSQMEKLERLIISVLALNDPEPKPEETSLVDMESVLSNVRENNAELLKENQCQFSGEANVKGDVQTNEKSMTLILDNLVSNAAKYCDKNKDFQFVKIIINEQKFDYSIRVVDNGLGIPEERLSEVFQMFKRFHPNVSFGSGLGLATVKKHVDYLKGSISLESSTKGTTFIITLPKEDTV